MATQQATAASQSPLDPSSLVDFNEPPTSIDVTRNDGIVTPTIFGSDVRLGVGEIGQVNLGPTGKEQDLMGFGYQESTYRSLSSSVIWMVSGFNPATTNVEGNGFQTVFIDTDGNHVAPSAISESGHVNRPNSEYGFEYAVNIIGVAGNLLTYQFVELSPSSILQTSYHTQNPWALISSNADSVIFTKTAEVKVMNTENTLLKTGVNTGGAYSDQFVWDYEIPSSKFDWMIPAAMQASTSSGGDTMTGVFVPEGLIASSDPIIITSPVPEPGSLIGVAGLLASALSIRSRRKQP